MSNSKIKNGIIALFVLSILVFSASNYAQTTGSGKGKAAAAKQTYGKNLTFQHGPRFVDANGDGICDNAKDSNGDGIPNCQDPTYKRPMDGTGRKNGMGMGRGYGMGLKGGGQGTGICDGTGPKGRASGK